MFNRQPLLSSSVCSCSARGSPCFYRIHTLQFDHACAAEHAVSANLTCWSPLQVAASAEHDSRSSDSDSSASLAPDYLSDLQRQSDASVEEDTASDSIRALPIKRQHLC